MILREMLHALRLQILIIQKTHFTKILKKVSDLEKEEIRWKLLALLLQLRKTKIPDLIIIHYLLCYKKRRLHFVQNLIHLIIQKKMFPGLVPILSNFQSMKKENTFQQNIKLFGQETLVNILVDATLPNKNALVQVLIHFKVLTYHQREGM